MDSQLDCVPHAQYIHTHTSLWDSCTQYSKTSEQRTHLGMGHLSLVERWSSSQRFCFKPIGNFLKTKITLKVFEMYYYNTFCFIFYGGICYRHSVYLYGRHGNAGCSTQWGHIFWPLHCPMLKRTAGIMSNCGNIVLSLWIQWRWHDEQLW